MSDETKEKKQPVFVPEGFANFTCGRCGECCREPERITISPAKYERLARALRDSGFPIPPGDALMREPGDEDGPATFALVGDRCVFLNAEGRCHLCDLNVPDLRGAWCISFPVAPLVTPRGVNYVISFACAKTAGMLRSRKPLNLLAVVLDGPPLTSTERPLTAKHRIPTTLNRPKLDWDDLRPIEGMLLAVARDWELNLADRLLVMPVMLEYLLEGYAGPGQPGGALRERVSQAAQRLPEMVKRVRALGFDRAAHYDALTALFSRRIGLRTRARLRKTVESALRQVRGRRTKISSDESGKVLAELYAKHYKPRARTFEHILGNYAICRLFANREMLTGGVYKGVYSVLYLVALIRFFAAAAAAERNALVDENMLIEAIRIVETSFTQIRTAFDFLDTPDEQQRMLDPACAAALIRI